MTIKEQYYALVNERNTPDLEGLKSLVCHSECLSFYSDHIFELHRKGDMFFILGINDIDRAILPNNGMIEDVVFTLEEMLRRKQEFLSMFPKYVYDKLKLEAYQRGLTL